MFNVIDIKTNVKIDEIKAARKEDAKRRKRAARKVREAVMKSLGLIKVKGNLGGTFWE